MAEELGLEGSWLPMRTQHRTGLVAGRVQQKPDLGGARVVRVLRQLQQHAGPVGVLLDDVLQPAMHASLMRPDCAILISLLAGSCLPAVRIGCVGGLPSNITS